MKPNKLFILGLATGLLALGGWKAFSHFKPPPSTAAVQQWVCPMRCLNRVYSHDGECDVCHMKLKPYAAPPVPADSGPRQWPLLRGRTAVYFRPYEVRKIGVERILRGAGPLKGRGLRLRLPLDDARALKRGGSAMVMPPQGYARPVQASVVGLGPAGRVDLELSRPISGSNWGLAELRVAFAPALAVPLPALFEDGSRAWVYVMRGEDFEPRAVTVTARGESYALVSGLEAGEIVAGSGVFWLDAQWRMDHP